MPNSKANSETNRKMFQRLEEALKATLEALLLENYKGGMTIRVEIKDGTMQNFETDVRKEFRY